MSRDAHFIPHCLRDEVNIKRRTVEMPMNHHQQTPISIEPEEVVQAIVVDHELVTRTFPDGPGAVEMVCVYEVNAGKIVKATFAIGQTRKWSH